MDDAQRGPQALWWRPRFSWVGFLLIVIGLWWLLGKLKVIPDFAWDYFWPLVLIALGLSLVVGRATRRRWW